MLKDQSLDPFFMQKLLGRWNGLSTCAIVIDAIWRLCMIM